MNILNSISDKIIQYYDFDMLINKINSMITNKDFTKEKTRDDFLSWIIGFGVYNGDGENPFISDIDTDKEGSDSDSDGDY